MIIDTYCMYVLVSLGLRYISIRNSFLALMVIKMTGLPTDNVKIGT